MRRAPRAMPSPRCIRALRAIRDPHHRHVLRDRSGPARLYREDQHRRQYAHPRQSDPPRIPPGRGRRVQPGSGRPFAHPHPRLGFFKDVDIKNTPGSQPDRTDLTVTVTEQSTGSISAGPRLFLDQPAGRRVQLYRTQSVRTRPESRTPACRSPRSSKISAQLHRALFPGPAACRRLRPGQDPRPITSRRPIRATRTGAALRLGFPVSEYSSRRAQLHLRDRADVRPSPMRRWKCSRRRASSNGSILGFTYAYNDLDDLRKPTKGLHFQLQPEFCRLRRNRSNFIKSSGSFSHL